MIERPSLEGRGENAVLHCRCGHSGPPHPYVYASFPGAPYPRLELICGWRDETGALRQCGNVYFASDLDPTYVDRDGTVPGDPPTTSGGRGWHRIEELVSVLDAAGARITETGT